MSRRDFISIPSERWWNELWVQSNYKVKAKKPESVASSMTAYDRLAKRFFVDGYSESGL